MPSAFDPAAIWVDGQLVAKANIRSDSTGLGKLVEELEHGGFVEGLIPINYSAANSQTQAHLSGVDDYLSGVVNSVSADSIVTVGDGTITTSGHGSLQINGTSLRQRVVMLRHATDQTQPVTITIADDFDRSVAFVQASDQTGTCIIQRETTATINGATSVALKGANAVAMLFVPVANAYLLNGDIVAPVNLGGNLDCNGYKVHNFIPEINQQTGTAYTTVDADRGKVITLNNGSAITLTVHQAAAAGFNCLLYQKGAGQVTVAAGGTGNIRNRQSHTKIAGQYGVASIFVESNAGTAPQVVLGGDTAA